MTTGSRACASFFFRCSRTLRSSFSIVAKSPSSKPADAPVTRYRQAKAGRMDFLSMGSPYSPTVT